MLKKTVLFLALVIAATSAQNLLNFSVGPTWPKADLVRNKNLKVAWNGAAEWGKVFDKRIIVGAKLDFSWHVVKEFGTWSLVDSAYVDSDEIRVKNRAFMVPVSGWIGIDPVPQYRFHPVIHAQVGFNSLFYSETNYNVGQPELPENVFKYYYGFYSKFGLDGMFDLGKSASVFAGFEYQIAPLYHKEDNRLEQISFNAPIIRLGVSFLY